GGETGDGEVAGGDEVVVFGRDGPGVGGAVVVGDPAGGGGTGGAPEVFVQQGGGGGGSGGREGGGGGDGGGERGGAWFHGCGLGWGIDQGVQVTGPRSGTTWTRA